MPELPDITVYLDALTARVLGHTLERVEVGSPFVLRSVDPPLAASHGARVTGLRRLGKRIVVALEPEFFRDDWPRSLDALEELTRKA